jgi:hypothetical protein
MRVVISQSMFFPWYGMLEQIKLADVFVHYDDVAFSKGSFTNRVQLKVPSGSRWLTLPLKDLHLGQKIDEVTIQSMDIWNGKHRYLLQESLGAAAHAQDAIEIYEAIMREHSNHSLSVIARSSMLSMASYFGLQKHTEFVDSKNLGIGGQSSDRVLAIVKALGGTEYITGHGARNYLDHQKFIEAGVEVEYMNYRYEPYQQSYGAFTPYVSALDLIANCGVDGAKLLRSDTVNWRIFCKKY